MKPMILRRWTDVLLVFTECLRRSSYLVYSWGLQETPINPISALQDGDAAESVKPM